MELLKPDCPWIALMIDENKVDYDTSKEVKDQGYNGYYHCLKKHYTG